MANDEHVALLKKGVEAWNAWRAKNANLRLDLIRANLGGANLARAYLDGANLARANLGHPAVLREGVRFPQVR
jgi:hypothetical protein